MEWLVLGCGSQASGSDNLTMTSETNTKGRWGEALHGACSDAIAIFVAVNYCHTLIHDRATVLSSGDCGWHPALLVSSPFSS